MSTAEIHLKTGDSPFNVDPAKSFTLPARFYTDDSVYEQEKETVFYKSWGMRVMLVRYRKPVTT